MVGQLALNQSIRVRILAPQQFDPLRSLMASTSAYAKSANCVKIKILMDKNPITVETIVKAPLSKVWEYWNKPEHIVHWAFAADDWEAPAAENDLRVGGKFKTVMAAKDKSASFDFGGVYTVVKENELIEYDMDDNPPSPDG